MYDVRLDTDNVVLRFVLCIGGGTRVGGYLSVGGLLVAQKGEVSSISDYLDISKENTHIT